MATLRNFLSGIVLLCILMVQACSLAPGEEDSIKAVFEQVRSGQFEKVESGLPPDQRTPETRRTLEQIQRELIPKAKAQSVSMLAWRLNVGTEGRTIAAEHEYKYADRILIVSTVLRESGNGKYAIDNFQVNSFSESDVKANRFTFEGKSITHWIFLFALSVSVTLMIAAIVCVVRAKDFKRKWLWVLVSLIGTPVFLLNWTTGGWEPHAVLGLINASVTRGLSPVEPWIVRFQIPVGALITFWLLYSHYQTRKYAGELNNPQT